MTTNNDSFSSRESRLVEESLDLVISELMYLSNLKHKQNSHGLAVTLADLASELANAREKLRAQQKGE